MNYSRLVMLWMRWKPSLPCQVTKLLFAAYQKRFRLVLINPFLCWRKSKSDKWNSWMRFPLRCFFIKMKSFCIDYAIFRYGNHLIHIQKNSHVSNNLISSEICSSSRKLKRNNFGIPLIFIQFSITHTKIGYNYSLKGQRALNFECERSGIMICCSKSIVIDVCQSNLKIENQFKIVK